MIIIKKIFSQIKNYWQLLIGLAIGIIGVVAVSKETQDEEISEIMNMSYANCRTTVSRAKESLRQKLQLVEN